MAPKVAPIIALSHFARNPACVFDDLTGADVNDAGWLDDDHEQNVNFAESRW